MAKIVNTVPQQIDPSRIITLQEALSILPNEIPFTENIALIGRIRYGQQIGVVGFTVQTDDNLTPEIRSFFTDLFTGIGSCASVNNDWRRKQFNPLWIYSDGKKLIDCKDNKIIHIKPIQPNNDLPIWLPVSKVIDRLKTIEWLFPFDCYITGGMVRENGSFNDVDFIVGQVSEDSNGDAVMQEVISRDKISEVRAMFMNKLGVDVGINEPMFFGRLHVDVGSMIMKDKGKVYLCKVFSKNNKIYCGP